MDSPPVRYFYHALFARIVVISLFFVFILLLYILCLIQRKPVITI